MAGVHGADRETMFAGDPPDGGGQPGPRVAVMVAVEVGGRAPEQLAESPQLVAQGGDRRLAIAGPSGMPAISPPPRKLEVKARLDPGLQQRLGLASLPQDH